MEETLIDWITEGHTEELKAYVERRGDVNETVIDDEDGCAMNLLHLTSGMDSEHRDEVMRFLLSLPQVDVNKPSGPQNDGWTAAHICACWGHEQTLSLLLESGSDPFICDINGINVWDIARSYDNFPCVYVLDKHLDKVPEDCDQTQYYSFTSLPEDSTVCYSYSYEPFLADNCPEAQVKSTNSSPSNSCIISKNIVKDEKFGVTFIEEFSRRSSLGDGEPVGQEYTEEVLATGAATADDTFDNINNTVLREQLICLGDSPGPITGSTKKIYSRRLKRLKRGSLFIPPSPGKSLPLPSHSLQLNRIINGEFKFEEAKQLERDLVAFFEKETSPKTYFTYLLLDPRTSKNLPSRSQSSQYKAFDASLFKQFADSVFYVGKGQGNRPFMHLYEAALSTNRNPLKVNNKVSRILDIWSQNLGVVSLHCFHSVSSNEALTRECFMIEALGITNLTNIQIGQNRVKALRWTDYKKRLLGSYLLYKAYNILLMNGERQVKRGDIEK